MNHGTYHTVSKKHLQRYIDGVVFRSNMRSEEMDTVFTEITKRMAQNGKLALQGTYHMKKETRGRKPKTHEPIRASFDKVLKAVGKSKYKDEKTIKRNKK